MMFPEWAPEPEAGSRNERELLFLEIIFSRHSETSVFSQGYHNNLITNNSITSEMFTGCTFYFYYKIRTGSIIFFLSF